MRKSAILFVLLIGLTSAAAADGPDYKLGHVTIRHPFAFPTIGQGKTASAYFMLKNHGEADRLIEAASDVADRAVLHTMSMTGDVMKMRPLQAVDLPAGAEVDLAPGGGHVMLIGMKRKLKIGDSFSLTLSFEKSGSIDVSVTVAERRTKTKHGEPGPGGMNHGSHGQSETTR